MLLIVNICKYKNSESYLDKKKHARYKNSNFFVLTKIITNLYNACFLAILRHLLIQFSLVFMVDLVIFSKIAIDNSEFYV